MDIMGDQYNINYFLLAHKKILNIIKHIYAYIAQRLLGFIESRFTRLRIIPVCQSKFSHIMCDQKKESINQIREKTYTMQTFSPNFYSMHTSIFKQTYIGGRRSPAVACWASDHWVGSSNPLRGKFRH